MRLASSAQRRKRLQGDVLANSQAFGYNKLPRMGDVRCVPTGLLSPMRFVDLKHAAGRLASYELFAVLVLTLVALARPQWGLVAVGGLVVLWAIRWLGSGRLSVRTALDGGVVVLLALALPAALWVSPDRSSSAVVAARLVLSIGLLYAVANSAVQGWRFLAAVAAAIGGATALAALGLVGAIRPAGQVVELPRALVPLNVPFQIHANVLATSLAAVLPLAAALTLWGAPPTWPRSVRPLAGLATLAMAAALLLTQSRGAIVGLALAATAMLALRWRRLRWPVAAAVVVGVAALAWLSAARPSGWSAGLAGREEVWRRALVAVADFPYTGIGMGLFDQVVPILYPYLLLGAGPVAQASHAHNLFLQVAVDLGVPGLVGFLAVLLTTGGLLARLWSNGDNGDRPLVWGLIGSLVAVTVHGQLDAAAWSSKASPLLWLLLGLTAALAQRGNRRTEQT